MRSQAENTIVVESEYCANVEGDGPHENDAQRARNWRRESPQRERAVERDLEKKTDASRDRREAENERENKSNESQAARACAARTKVSATAAVAITHGERERERDRSTRARQRVP